MPPRADPGFVGRDLGSQGGPTTQYRLAGVPEIDKRGSHGDHAFRPPRALENMSDADSNTLALGVSLTLNTGYSECRQGLETFI